MVREEVGMGEEPTNKYRSLDLGTIEAVFNKLGGLEGAQMFLRGETEVVIAVPITIVVDRSIRPTYGSGTGLVMNPELEDTGPAEYDLVKDVFLWRHDAQKGEKVLLGYEIFRYLKEKDVLSTCLSLRDGEEIQKRGVAVFQKIFHKNVVPLWKSVVSSQAGRSMLYVPCLEVDGDRVRLTWYWLGNEFNTFWPAARFRYRK